MAACWDLCRAFPSTATPQDSANLLWPTCTLPSRLLPAQPLASALGWLSRTHARCYQRTCARSPRVQCCFTSTDIIRLITDVEPRTATSTKECSTGGFYGSHLLQSLLTLVRVLGTNSLASKLPFSQYLSGTNSNNNLVLSN